MSFQPDKWWSFHDSGNKYPSSTTVFPKYHKIKRYKVKLRPYVRVRYCPYMGPYGKSVSWERDNHRHHRQHDNRIDLFQENLHDNCALLDNTNQLGYDGRDQLNNSPALINYHIANTLYFQCFLNFCFCSIELFFT